MKSYTDLEQSKKLAEILPIESADMFYFDDNGGDPKFKVRNGITYYYDSEDCLPCWSLAALLNIMPQINEWITPYGHKNDKLSQFEPKICKLWEHSIIPSYKVTYGNGLFTDIYDNPVDACVAMIEKLHKLDLL